MKCSFLLMACALAAACASDHAPTTAGTAGACSSLGLGVSPSSVTLHPGDTIRVVGSDPACSGADAQTFAPYRWLSSDSLIAVVDPVLGLVRARTEGTANIIAESIREPAERGAMALRVIP